MTTAQVLLAAGFKPLGRAATYASRARRAGKVSGEEFSAVRTAARRRRVGIIATAVAVVGLVAGWFAIQRWSPVQASADQPSSTPLRSTSPAALGLDVLADGVIHRPDGSRVGLALPEGVTAYGARSVPGGWVLATSPRDELWFAPGGAPPRLIGRLSGGYALSAEGDVLVMAHNLFPPNGEVSMSSHTSCHPSPSWAGACSTLKASMERIRRSWG